MASLLSLSSLSHDFTGDGYQEPERLRVACVDLDSEPVNAVASALAHLCGAWRNSGFRDVATSGDSGISGASRISWRNLLGKSHLLTGVCQQQEGVANTGKYVVVIGGHEGI